MWRYIYLIFSCSVAIICLLLIAFSEYQIAAFIMSFVAIVISFFNFWEILKKKYTPSLEAEIRKGGEYDYRLSIYNSGDQLMEINLKLTGWKIGMEIKNSSEHDCEVIESGTHDNPGISSKGKLIIRYKGLDINNLREKFPLESKGNFVVTTSKGQVFQAKVNKAFLSQFR